MNELLNTTLDETKNKRTEALQNAKESLRQAFEKMGCPVETDSKPIQQTDELSESDLNEIIDELEQDGEDEEKIKKPSFIQNLAVSLKRKKINSRNAMRCRFQKLANIKSTCPVAVLTIKDGVSIDFSEIPPWYDIVRFKLCGFDFEIFKLE